MNNLLLFFAFPIAVIIISAILQKLLNSPVAVAAFIFAIFIVVTFAAFDETFLIATLAYTILAFITAIITRFLCKGNNCICEALSNLLNNNTGNNENTNNINTINNTLNEILDSINNSNNSTNNGNNNGCGCRYNRYRRF